MNRVAAIPLAGASSRDVARYWLRPISYVEMSDEELAAIADLWRNE